MKWQKIKIKCQSGDLEGLTGLLLNLGQEELYIEDGALINDLINQKTGAWDYIDPGLLEKNKNEAKIEFYLPGYKNNTDFLAEFSKALQKLKESNGEFTPIEVSDEIIDDEDWQNTWKKFFKPFLIGERLVIKASWEQYSPQADQIVVEIDPGQAFGSGQHATTALCLEALEKVIKPGAKAADIGCGSGILSLAAALLGAEKIDAVDNDPKAVEICRANAALNKAEDKIKVFLGDLSQCLKGEYDIILANIVADAIMALAPQIYPLLKEGGIFIASGIISQRVPEVEKALSQGGYCIREKALRDDWAAYTAVKKGKGA